MKRRTKVTLIVTSSVVAVALLAVTGVTMYQKTTHKSEATVKAGYQTYTVTTSPDLSMTGKVIALVPAIWSFIFLNSFR